MSSRNLELEAAIERDPDDREAYRVYADWLEGHGDPRAELIRAQLADSNPDEPGKPVRKLLVEQRAALLGPLFVYAKSLTWRYGFLRTAKLKDTGSSCAPHVVYLLDSMVGRFLRELDVRARDLGPAAAQLSRLPSTLRALGLSHDGPTIELATLPPLTQLSLTGRFELDELPELEHARLHITQLSAATAQALTSAPLSKLRRLELGLIGPLATATDLAPLFERTDLAQLTDLALPHVTSPLADELARLIVAAPFAAELDSLALPGLTDAGARTLATARASVLTRLRILDVTGGELAEDTWQQLDAMELEELVQYDRYDWTPE